jgi:nucleoside 2-deoxyribosyltransferase
MRGKGFLREVGVLSNSGAGYPEHAMSTPAGVTTRDYNDVRTCDAMIACYLESNNKESLGTAAEFGFCHALHKPIIAIGPEDEVNIRHLMLNRMAGYRVDTLEEASILATHLLTPGL